MGFRFANKTKVFGFTSCSFGNDTLQKTNPEKRTQVVYTPLFQIEEKGLQQSMAKSR
jgi:hypothetical protein